MGPAVAISLVVHAAFFLAVGLIVPRPYLASFPPDHPLAVILVPQVQAPPPPRAQARTQAATVARAAPPPPLQNIHIPRAVAPTAPPSPIPAPPAAAAPGKGQGQGPGIGSAPAPLPAGEGERGVQAFLRGTVGCETPDLMKLTPAERARCTDRFVEAARNAPPIGIDPAKRGAYAAQAAADERRRAQRDALGSEQLLKPCEGPGSNFGVGCLRDSSMAHVRIP